MNQFLHRFWILALIPIVVVTSVANSRLTAHPRIIEVRITIPDEEQNLTLGQGLLELVNLSTILARLATEGPQQMGAGLEEIIFLIELAENSTDRMWSRLHQEIVDQYQGISSMAYRFHQALVHPDIFSPNWFEDPHEAHRYSEEAKELGITSAQQEKVHIELATNMSLAHATTRDNWTMSNGEVIPINTTYVLVRDGEIWKYRTVSWVRVGS